MTQSGTPGSSTSLTDEAAVQRTIEALKARNMDALVVDSGSDALAVLKEMLPEAAEIYNNTSETLDDIGFSAYVSHNPRFRNYHDDLTAESDPQKQRDIRRNASLADYFIGSVQAIAESGEVVVASGSGSQIPAYAFNAAHVIWVVGVQKICSTLEEAIARVRGYTVERHDAWLVDQGRNPAPIGKLMICEREGVPGRITVILIRQSLGW